MMGKLRCVVVGWELIGASNMNSVLLNLHRDRTRGRSMRVGLARPRSKMSKLPECPGLDR